MDEGPSSPVVRQTGATTGTPQGDDIAFGIAVIRSGRGDMSA